MSQLKGPGQKGGKDKKTKVTLHFNFQALKHSSIETEASEYNTTGELTRMNWLKAGNNPVELSSLSLA